MNAQLLHEVSAFIWKEAHLLDNELYNDWLKLWTTDGLYIVPIDPKETDLENTLNFAYDNAHMRELRVQRLVGGESISTSPDPRTVRLISRFFIESDEGDTIKVCCAQFLTDFRKETSHQYVANLSYTLRRSGAEFVIHNKIVRLINSDDVLNTIAYIL